MRKPLVAMIASFLIVTAPAAGEDWPVHGGTENGQRFSPIDQINEKTISRLGLAWSQELGTTRGLEATPLVESGVIYTTGSWSVVFAFDAKTGRSKWTYDPKVPRDRAYFMCCDVVNRGVALHNGKVYVGTIDGRLVALDQRTGSAVWSVQTTDPTKPYSVTDAPTIAKDKVVIGNSGSEYGVRGYVTAYDTDTGKQLWRFYTVPGDPKNGFESKAMEAAAKTWSGTEWWKAGGGGTAWGGMSYDPVLDLLFFGTGNPVAWYRSLRGEGDSLYTACILAVKGATGELCT
jgi:quinohemoprotein ethanol dehydrogenase